MSLITETILRDMLKNDNTKVITLYPGDIITPSARQFIKDRRIELLTLDKPVKENFYQAFEKIQNDFEPKFVSSYDGGFYSEKPEHMTHLKGNKLVFKDDARIIFRGRIDSLESLIMEIQLQLLKSPFTSLVKELDELLDIVRHVLRAEVVDEPITIKSLLGLSDQELREHSHHPKKHFGIEHFVPDVSMGVEVVLLNKLRTEIREVELIAIKTFHKEFSMEREDIIKVLNRLSSATYVLMCRIRGNYYAKERF